MKYNVTLNWILFFLITCTVQVQSRDKTDENKIFKLSKSEKKENFRFLFDGSSMDNWVGNKTEYVLEDGCIVMRTQQNIGGNLYTKDSFDNFVLRFEFMLTPEANNGLGIRHQTMDDKNYQGMELQILDNEAPVYADLKPYQYHGSLYGYAPARRGFLKKTGEWNQQEVIADGSRIKITLNGEVILDTDINEVTKDIPAEKIQKGLLNKNGRIAFLGHGSVVKFRNIRIKEIR